MAGSDQQRNIHHRLTMLLERLAEQGTTQLEVARRANFAPQYLSDVKLERKPITELFARRLADSFEFDYRWLMSGEGDPPRVLEAGARKTPPESTIVRLPVFHSPILGDPWSHAAWDGTTASLAGAAAALARSAKQPYVLRFGRADHRRRLQENDLLLVSQELSAQAEIHLVRSGSKLYLARKAPKARWQRVANGKLLEGTWQPVGHCIGIIWGLLLQTEGVSTS